MSRSEQNVREIGRKTKNTAFAFPTSCRILFTLCAKAFLQVLTSSASAARNPRPSPLPLPRQLPLPGISSPVPLGNSGLDRSKPAFPQSTDSRPCLLLPPPSQPENGKRERAREGREGKKRDRESEKNER